MIRMQHIHATENLQSTEKLQSNLGPPIEKTLIQHGQMLQNIKSVEPFEFLDTT